MDDRTRGAVGLAAIVAAGAFAVGLVAGGLNGRDQGQQQAYDDRCSAVGGHLEAGRICIKGDSVLWRASDDY